MRDDSRYIILGAGAVGGTIAARLALAFGNVAADRLLVVARGEHGAAIARHGLLLRQPSGDHRVRLQVVPDAAAAELRDKDIVLLAVKSQDTRQALRDIAATGRDPAIVCLQNGITNESTAAAMFSRVLGAMVWTPASHLEPGIVECFADPAMALRIGRFRSGSNGTGDATCERITRDLERAGCEAKVVDDIMCWKRGKMLGNLANAVDAICVPGEDARCLADDVCAEGAAVLRAAGLPFVSPDDLRQRMAHALTVATIGDKQRAGGSTWQSLTRGKTLETDALQGEILRIAAECGAPAPLNHALLRLSRTTQSPRSVFAARVRTEAHW